MFRLNILAIFSITGLIFLNVSKAQYAKIEKLAFVPRRAWSGEGYNCERCGGEISIKRLKARPVATLCIECKTKEETLEKVIGI
jgi:DnaK suppressor protein